MIAHVVSAGWSDSAGGTSYTRSFNNTGAAGDLLVSGSIHTGTVTGITYNAEALTSRLNFSGFYTGDIYTLGDGSIATGANNLVITFADAGREVEWFASIYSGANGTSFGNTATDAETTTTSNITLTTANDNSWHYSVHGANTVNAGANFTSADGTVRAENFPGTNISAGIIDDPQASAGANTNTGAWDGDSVVNMAGSLEIKEAAAAVANSGFLNFMGPQPQQ